MSSQHDKRKHQIAVKIPHRVWRQIEKAAENHKMKPSQFIRWVLTEEVDSIELTAKDAMIIARRIREAEKKGRMV